MKKLLLIFALVVGGYYVSNAQTPADIYNTFASDTKVTTISVSDFAIKLAGENDDLVKNIESIQVLSLSNCDVDVKDRFAKAVNSLKTEGFETLVKVNHDDKTVKVFAKVNNDIINELLVVTTGKYPVLVVLKGSISKSELMSKSNTLSKNFSLNM